MKMTALVLSAIFAMSPTRAEAMKYLARTLDQRTASAEVVVVGELVAISTRAYSFSTHRLTKMNYTAFYDSASIKISESLKRDTNSDSIIYVLLDSRDQPENPWRLYHVFHEIGEKGVWFLRRDWHTSIYFLDGPEPNPMPLATRDEIMRLPVKR